MTFKHQCNLNILKRIRKMKNHETIVINNHNCKIIGSAYERAVTDFDSSKSCFNTHLSWKLKGQKSIERKKKKTKNHRQSSFPVESIMSNICPPDKEYEFKELLENLSKDAFSVAMICLDPPTDLVDIVMEKKKQKSLTMNCIRKYLRKIGWDFLKIEKTFNELKLALY